MFYNKIDHKHAIVPTFVLKFPISRAPQTSPQWWKKKGFAISEIILKLLKLLVQCIPRIISVKFCQNPFNTLGGNIV